MRTSISIAATKTPTVAVTPKVEFRPVQPFRYALPYTKLIDYFLLSFYFKAMLIAKRNGKLKKNFVSRPVSVFKSRRKEAILNLSADQFSPFRFSLFPRNFF